MKELVRYCWPYLLVLFSTFWELLLSNGYFQVSGELLSIIALIAFSCLLGILGWFLSKSLNVRVRHYGDRALFTLLFTFVVYMLWGRAHSEVELLSVRIPAVFIVIGSASLFLFFSLVSTLDFWRRIKSSVAVAVAIFVLSQPLFVMLVAPSVKWPSVSAAVGSTVPSEGKSATVFLLLDEFSASEKGKILSALDGLSVKVNSKSIDSVGNRTADVIPQLFSGNNFRSAKPCGLTSICSGANILAFARIVVTRPDIDLVGFYHPYCAIMGLRSCALITRPNPLWDTTRWGCAIRNLEGEFAALKPECKPTSLLPRFEEAVFAAPIWREGGVMFAHLPLPHPPGEVPGNSLTEEYQHNLARAGQFVVRIVQHAQQSGILRLRLVIFSDHPLRKDLWCAQQRYKNAAGCEALVAEQETQVPLIVVSNGEPLPSIDRIKNNAQIFDLLAN